MVKWKCAVCRRVVSPPREGGGRTGKCKQCGTALVVPGADALARDYGVVVGGNGVPINEDKVAALVADFRSPENAVRHNAALDLTKLAAFRLWDLRRPDVVAALVAALADPYPPARVRAAEALGEVRDPGAIPALVAALNGGDDELKLTLVEALEVIADPGGVRAAAAALSPNRRARAEWDSLAARGSEALSWGVYGGVRFYRRAARLLRDPARAGLTDAERVSVAWYAGGFGLAAGVAPATCRAHYEAGIALSPSRGHSILIDYWCLRYITALLERDRPGVDEARQWCEAYPGRNFSWDLDEYADHLARRSLSFPRDFRVRSEV